MAAPLSKLRERLPVCHLPPEELRLLSSRHSAMKHKAAARGIEFPWPRFSQYLGVILGKAPAGYRPSEFRIKHGPEGYDFRPEALEIRRKGGSVDPARAVEAELAVKLLTEEGELDQLAWEAELAAGQ
jgi:hypothetical protein